MTPARFVSGRGARHAPQRRPEMTRHRWMDAALAVSLLVLPAASYADDPADSLGGTGVTLYEISERVTFDPDPSSPGVVRRNATSPPKGLRNWERLCARPSC